MIKVYIIAVYLLLLLVLGLFAGKLFKGTSKDYFLASRSIGPFLLLMSLFGTTMTAFALVGSTGESFASGVGVYGKLASSSGIIHSLCFFIVGIKVWSLGARHGYMTQIQFFRDRFQSDKLGLLLFPILVGLVIPYLLLGVMGAGITLEKATGGAMPEFFASTGGGIPFALGSGVVCVVVMIYVFFGGVRGTAWANAFQTIVFIILGFVTFFVIADKMGGPVAATQRVIDHHPTKLQRAVHPDDLARYEAATAAFPNEEAIAAWEAALADSRDEKKPAEIKAPKEPHGISKLAFLTYFFIPLSVGMFPHLFQHWLTAKSAKSFKLSVVAHPLLIMLVWVPCVMIGAWATSAVMPSGAPVVPPGFNPNAVLSLLVAKLTSPILGGFLTAGILAAIMSSLDSQFLCLGSIFTNDIFLHYSKNKNITDKQKVVVGRIFVVVVVVVTYLLAIALRGTPVFTLGVWCFSGFAALFPLVIAALYWKRATREGAFACVIATAISWCWLFYKSDFASNREFLFLGMMPVATMIFVSTLALIVVSLATKAPDEKHLQKFFPKKS
ncbi:sodium:solute symporter family protein [Verrucomicrobia bacterium]|nr:sodium:solute symporter family protein [Verrucomicrobiota bacterium]